ASKNAGAPAFTLLVKGTSFANTSVVNWNGSALTTTYVSATQLKAAVPAANIASPGTAHITVSTPGAGTSAATKTFTILLTTLKLTSATLTKGSTSYTATISLKNLGFQTAPNVTLTKATLNAVKTTTTLPMSVGSIAAGSTGTASLTFPLSSGTSGSVVTLAVSGTFTGGKFSGSLKVTLP
ncbi:MAG TPA: IPT/TIG domain-containing protein, partial [Chthonomonadaceae bacterium]|nr:IPT/TIG domain-containing protein [Chthonomonadaceae bacterium]